jgi:hypothetical protein
MSNTLGSFVLPTGTYWANELDWWPYTQTSAYTIPGAIVVEEWPKLSGREIELRDIWATRDDVYAISAALQTGSSLLLTWNGTQYHVLPNGSKPISGGTVIDNLADPDSSTIYNISIKLIEAA